jgi:hypothetical protein
MSSPKIYSYPDFFVNEDLGSISLSSTETTDFGPISTSYETNENYGSITVLSTPPFGSADVEGNVADSRTYDYNILSVVPNEEPEDYGSIESSVLEIDDYGVVGAALTEGIQSYGSIITSGDALPYGTIEISGSAEISAQVLNIHFGSGTITVSGEAINEQYTASDVGIGTFSAIGGAAEVSVVNPPDQTVDISISGSKIESRTYDYNEDSAFILDPYEDYGSIEDSTSYEDYGSITAIVSYEDYGSVEPPFAESVYPYGTIEISGESESKFISQGGEQTLLFNIFGNAVESYQPNPSDQTVLINISGESTEIFTDSYVGSGLFSAFGDKLESVTYDYNENSIVIYEEPEDYGSIGSTITTIDDYGIVGAGISGIDNYGSIINLSNVLPYGTIEISGAAEVEIQILNIQFGSGTINISGEATNEQYTASDVGIGTFSALSGAAEVSGIVEDETVDITISGSKVESRSYSYNEDSVIIFEGYEDYGLIIDNVSYEDYGFISSEVGYEGYTDFGFIVTNETTFSYGTIQVSGESESKFISQGGEQTLLFNIFGNAVESYQPNPPDQTVLFNISGNSLDFGLFSEVGSGFFSALGDKLESVTYDYNENSIVIYEEPEDYGSVGSAVTSVIDYGIVGAGISGIDNYGSIINLSNVLPYGTIEISGAAEVEIQILNIQFGSGTINISGAATNEQYTASDVGIGTFSAIGGAAEVSVVNPPDQTVDISISGSKIESRSYSYNEDSAFILDPYEDYGSIEDSTSYEDYGFIFDQTSYEDYGSVEPPFTESVYPYGTIEISGESESKFISQGGEQTLLFNISGTLVEKNTESDVGIGSAVISGESIEIITDSYIGSGFFSAFGSKVESRSYSYNEDSVVIYEEPEDYGSVGSTITTIDDYGIVGAGISGIDNYGSIINLSNVLPYGTIEISGAAEVEIQILNIQFGSGTITVSGEATNEQYTASDVGIGSAVISGESDESSVDSYVGSGFFSSFGDKIESVTYDYNEDSINVFEGYEDYGFITDSVSYEDYGLISSEVGYEGYTDFGFIISNETLIPYGTIEISGESESKFISQGGEQTLLFNIFGTLVEKNTESDVGIGTFSAIGGAAEVSVVNPPDQTVDISISGSKIESRSYSYNEDSAFILDPYEDYGLITDSVSYEDYGSITDSVSYEDYGSVEPPFTESVLPYGTIEISGAAVIVLDIANIQIGSGTINIFGNAADSYQPNPPDQTVLFNISGNSLNSGLFPEVGSGFFSAFGSKVESRSYSYNKDSVVIYEEPEDYGSVGSAVTSFSDYGIVGAGISGIDNYGSIITLNTTSPFGTIEISGAATNAQRVPAYSGSGTISAISGSADSLGVDPPDQTVLITLSGNADTAVTTLYVYEGFTDIEISGESENDIDSVYTYSGSGITTIFGAATNVQRVPAYSGSGTISAISGSADSLGVDPPDQTVLITLAGNADTDVDFIYTYSGSGVTTIFGEETVEKFAASDAGIGTVVVSGTATNVQRVPAYVGSGTIEIFGSADESFIPERESGSGTIDIDGEGNESITYVYGENSINAYFVIDYGFINEIVEYEDLTFLDEIIRIYEDYGSIEFGDQSVFPYGTIEISGESDNREIGVYTYSGTGTVDISGEASDLKEISSYAGSGQIIISGSVDDNYIPSSYIGFGTIFAISGAAEVYGPNPPDNTLLFEITGAAETRFEFEYRYNGVGIATFFGESENRYIASFLYQGLTDIEIAGGIRTDIGIYVPSISGVGIVTISGSAIDVYGPNPQENTVLFEITGIGSESFTYANYDGTGSIIIDGVGIAISNPFRAPFVFVTII